MTMTIASSPAGSWILRGFSARSAGASWSSVLRLSVRRRTWSLRKRATSSYRARTRSVGNGRNTRAVCNGGGSLLWFLMHRLPDERVGLCGVAACWEEAHLIICLLPKSRGRSVSFNRHLERWPVGLASALQFHVGWQYYHLLGLQRQIRSQLQLRSTAHSNEGTDYVPLS